MKDKNKHKLIRYGILDLTRKQLKRLLAEMHKKKAK